MEEFITCVIYLVGMFATFGAIAANCAAAAVLFSVGWPAYWCAYFGYWLAN